MSHHYQGYELLFSARWKIILLKLNFRFEKQKKKKSRKCRYPKLFRQPRRKNHSRSNVGEIPSWTVCDNKTGVFSFSPFPRRFPGFNIHLWAVWIISNVMQVWQAQKAVRFCFFGFNRYVPRWLHPPKICLACVSFGTTIRHSLWYNCQAIWR